VSPRWRGHCWCHQRSRNGRRISRSIPIGTISGTVTVTGTVAISGGTVNIGTISGAVTINTANVNVINTPTVTPLPQWTQLLTNSVNPVGVAIAGLTAYNSMVILCELTVATGNAQTTAAIDPGLTRNLTTVNNDIYYQQGTDPLGGLGDLTLTTFPLHGADHASLITTRIGGTGMSQTVNVWGSNEVLPYTHRTIQNGNGIMLFENTFTITNTQVQSAIPITSHPVRMYIHSAAGSTVNQIVRLIDNTSNGATQQLQAWTLTPGADVNQPKFVSVYTAAIPINSGTTAYNQVLNATFSNQGGVASYFSLPHTLNPMYLQFDANAGTSTILVSYIVDTLGL